jgi:hypothetical protein
MTLLIGPSTSIGTLKAIVSKVSNKKDQDIFNGLNYTFSTKMCVGPREFIDKHDLGLEGCLQKVMQDPQCKKHTFYMGLTAIVAASRFLVHQSQGARLQASTKSALRMM